MQDLITQTGEHQIQMTEVPGSILTGIIFFFWNFCLHIVKPLMPIMPLQCIVNFDIFWKILIEQESPPA